MERDLPRDDTLPMRSQAPRLPRALAAQRSAIASVRSRAGLALALLALACGGSGGSTTPIRAEATALVAIADCDAGSVGDFFISLTLSEEVDFDLEVLDAVEDVLVQVDSGDIAAVSDALVRGSVPSGEESRIIVDVEYFENDPGGPQASTRVTYAFDFDPDQACWTVAGENDCLGDSGEIYSDTVFLNDGPACSAQLAWRLLAE